MINLPDSALVLPSMTKLVSSNIHSVGYSQHNPETTYFYVRFKSLKVYVYEMTIDEASLHFGLIRGENISSGSYFNQNIKENYPFIDISDRIQTNAVLWSEVFSPYSSIGIRCGLKISSNELDIL